MVTIDDEGNKVNCWVEYRFDTTTNEVVEVKHATILAEADDEEHWMSRITCDTDELDKGMTICTMFVSCCYGVVVFSLSLAHLQGIGVGCDHLRHDHCPTRNR